MVHALVGITIRGRWVVTMRLRHVQGSEALQACEHDWTQTAPIHSVARQKSTTSHISQSEGHGN